MRLSPIALVWAVLLAPAAYAATPAAGTTTLGDAPAPLPSSTPAPVPSVPPLQQRSPNVAGPVPDRLTPQAVVGGGPGASRAGPVNATPFSAAPSGTFPGNASPGASRAVVPGGLGGGTPNLSK